MLAGCLSVVADRAGDDDSEMEEEEETKQAPQKLHQQQQEQKQQHPEQQQRKQQAGQRQRQRQRQRQLQPAALDAIITSCRQSAEWGVRVLKGPWARLRTELTTLPNERLLLLANIVRLANVRTRLMGINQITTVLDRDREQQQQRQQPEHLRPAAERTSNDDDAVASLYFAI